jgi:hypothetical protein
VRQCIYSASINQQTPNVDISLELYPEPVSIQDYHPLAKLRLETAWANQMTWHCARVTNFCFEKYTTTDTGPRMKIWSTLWDDVRYWKNNRPASFNPMWTGQSGSSVFPEMLFIADWHSISDLPFIQINTDNRQWSLMASTTIAAFYCSPTNLGQSSHCAL